MKPNLSLLLSIVFLTSCSSKFKSKSDLNFDDVKGNAKEITINTYDPVEKFGEVSNGRLTNNTVIQYNKDGNVTTIKDTFYPDSSEAKSTSIGTYQYNDKGEKVSYKLADSKKPTVFFTYNSDNQIAEINEYNDNGKLVNKTKKSYDDKGSLNEENSYNADGSLANKSIYKRNDAGKLIEFSRYDSVGALDHKALLGYDDKQQVITQKISSKSSITNISLKYASYDQQQNWEKQVIYFDNKPYQIKERAIKYY